MYFCHVYIYLVINHLPYMSLAVNNLLRTSSLKMTFPIAPIKSLTRPHPLLWRGPGRGLPRSRKLCIFVMFASIWLSIIYHTCHWQVSKDNFQVTLYPIIPIIYL